MRFQPKTLTLPSLALLLLPIPGQAQQRPMYELPTITVASLSEAHPLHAQAAALYEEAKWEEAATLHREAAEQAPENGPDAYQGYDRAARLYFYAGKYREAREMMEMAAHVAKATGDIVDAAYRHVDAGFIAVWEGYPSKRRENVKAAEAYAKMDGFGEEGATKIHALARGVDTLPIKEEGE